MKTPIYGDIFTNSILYVYQICKHFLDAVENGKYGWFWACPNGGDQCMYRHALPPGFVLKKVRKAILNVNTNDHRKSNQDIKLKLRNIVLSLYIVLQDRKRDYQKDQLSIEELVETKRAELSARTDLTPVTLESFVRWKKRKLGLKMKIHLRI